MMICYVYCYILLYYIIVDVISPGTQVTDSPWFSAHVVLPPDSGAPASAARKIWPLVSSSAIFYRQAWWKFTNSGKISQEFNGIYGI